MSGEAGFEGDVRRADPDRWLASRFIAQPQARRDVTALYAFDAELARAGRIAPNPLMAEVRLTWWREVVEQAFAGGEAGAHPLAQTLADVIRRRSLDRIRLEAMIEGHLQVLGRSRLDLREASRWAEAVTGGAATLAAGLLDPQAPAEAAGPAGEVWGLWVLARQGRAPAEIVIPVVRERLAHASKEARRLSAAAFPAAAHAALARAWVEGRGQGPLATRLRLLGAVVTGRI